MLRMSRWNTCGAIIGFFGFVGGFGIVIFQDYFKNGHFTSYSLTMIALALFVGTLFFVVFWLTFGQDTLLKTGHPAQATVLEVQDTGVTVNHNTIRVRLILRVSAPGMPPYETKTHTFVSRLNPGAYCPGLVLNVRYNPRNPKKVAVEGPAETPPPGQTFQTFGSAQGTTTTTSWSSTSGEISAEAQQALDMAMGMLNRDENKDGIPDVFQGQGGENVQVIDLRGQQGMGSQDPAERLRKLDELRRSGLITEQEYQAKRAEILKGM